MVYKHYGFIANPKKTTLHNASDMLAQMPLWFYLTKPTNSACHNLCNQLPPPPNYRALLGLGMKFIPVPRYTNSANLTGWTDRYRQDMFTKMFLAHQESTIPRLFIRSDWTPPIRMVNYNLQLRVNNFIKGIFKLFQHKRARSNMLPFQRRLLATMRTSKTHVIINADKNLGPCIIERSQYIRRALQDHLLDTSTYKRLTQTQAKRQMNSLKDKLQQFLEYYKNKLDPADTKYLQRTTVTQDPYPKFYLTAKIHKTPWKSRPIVSVSGSLLDGLGRWVDKILQPYFKETKSSILSSTTLKDILVDLPKLPPTARLFTTDAVSMYTNIDTNHALKVLKKFIYKHQAHATIHEKSAVIEGLEIIMTNNIFQFGDTYWHQLNGTAMGVSPSCMYATLYYAAHEETFVTKYPELRLYKRYIDDVIGIWVPQSFNDDQRWHQFQLDMNQFGSLRWEFTKRQLTVNFLDLTITIDTNGIIQTRLYEKPENLYLYLPANSAHPFSTLKGLIHGMVYRTIRLTSTKALQALELQNLVRRLTARGYKQSLLVDIINKTYQRINKELDKPATTPQPVPNNDHKKVCFFHTYYHPNDPKASDIQQLFQNEMMTPPRMYKKLPDLLNHRKAKLGVEKLIIAYHRMPNLGNILSTRIIKSEDGPQVSSFI
jgi:hypothetical protein